VSIRPHILAISLAFIPSAMAHPVHATFAEAVWNPKTHSVEVALRVRGVDLESALSVGREKRVDLDKTTEVDALIGAYLKKHIRFVGTDGKAVKLKWSDKDVGVTNTWLYFEFPLPADAKPAGGKVSNTIFFDDLDGQKNVVEYRNGKLKQILAFEGKVREITVRGAE
jgi:hypothetical protein